MRSSTFPDRNIGKINQARPSSSLFKKWIEKYGSTPGVDRRHSLLSPGYAAEISTSGGPAHNQTERCTEQLGYESYQKILKKVAHDQQVLEEI